MSSLLVLLHFSCHSVYSWRSHNEYPQLKKKNFFITLFADVTPKMTSNQIKLTILQSIECCCVNCKWRVMEALILFCLMFGNVSKMFEPACRSGLDAVVLSGSCSIWLHLCSVGVAYFFIWEKTGEADCFRLILWWYSSWGFML